MPRYKRDQGLSIASLDPFVRRGAFCPGAVASGGLLEWDEPGDTPLVAVAQYIPDDSEERSSLLTLLQDHEEQEQLIEQATHKAAELFPTFEIVFDGTRYDPWDPPLTLSIAVTQPIEEFTAAYSAYVQWLTAQPAYDRSVLRIMPVWHGPLDATASE